MTTTGKVFLSCAFGGGIGALVALSLWQPIWWLGMLAGGLVGYLSYEFKAVIAVIPMAWRSATTKRARVRWRIFRRVALKGMALCANFVPVALGVSAIMWLSSADIAAIKLFLILVGGFYVLICIGWTGMAATMMALGSIYEDSGFCNNLQGCSPLNVYGRVLPRLIVKMAYCIIYAAPGVMAGLFYQLCSTVVAFAVWLKRFGRRLFIEIHSELRLLCGADAMLGAVVGYFFGHALIGALVGGVLGVVNYKVISEWWLRLVPSR